MKQKKSARFLSAQKSKGFPTCPMCESNHISEEDYCENCFYEFREEVQMVVDEGKIWGEIKWKTKLVG